MLDRWGELRARDLLAWPVFALSLFWAVALHFADGATNHRTEIPLRLVLLISTQILQFAIPGFVALLVLPLLHHRHEAAAMIAAVVIGAAARSVLLANGLVALGLETSDKSAFRIESGLVHQSTAMIIGWVVVAGVRGHNARRGRLHNEQRQVRLLRAKADEDLQILDRGATESIRVDLLTAIEGLRGTDAAATLSGLRNVIEDVVRPLSRRLESGAQTWVAPITDEVSERVDWWRAVREAGEPRHIRPLAIMVILAWLTWPYALLNFGADVAVATIAFGLGVGTPMIAVARGLAIKFTSDTSAPVRLIVSVATLLLAGQLVGLGTWVLMHEVTSVNIYIAGAPAFILPLGLAIALLHSAREQRRSLENELRQSTEELRWSLARARERHRQHRRALDQALHGRVQALVASAILRLEKAMATSQEADAVALELQEMLAAGVRNLDLRRSETETLDVVLQRMSATWHGVLDVEFRAGPQVREALDSDPQTAVAVNDVLTELAFLSTRSSAQSLLISMRMLDARTLQLSIRDDGRASALERESLAVRLLEDCAVRWRRDRVAGFNETLLQLPIDSQMSILDLGSQETSAALPAPRTYMVLPEWGRNLIPSDLDARRLFTWPVFLPSLAWSGLLHFLNSTNNFDLARTWSPRLALLVVVHILMFLPAYVAYRMPRLWGTERNRTIAVAVGAVLGSALRGAALGLGLELLDLGPGIYVMRTASSVMNMAVAVGLLWVSASEAALHRERANALRRDRDQLLLLQRGALLEREELDRRLIEQVRESLLHELDAAGASSALVVLQRLRMLIDEVVRPLSHRLEAASEQWQPPTTTATASDVAWWQAFAGAMKPDRIPARVIPIGLAWIATPWLLSNNGATIWAAMCLASVFLGIPIFVAVRGIAARIARALPDSWQAPLWLAALLSAGIAFGSSTVAFMQFTATPLIMLKLVPVFTLLVGSFSCLALAARDAALATERELQASTADLRWSLARARELHRQRRRTLAHSVHGPLQSALAGAVLQLEQALQRGEATEQRVLTLQRTVSDFIIGLDFDSASVDPLAAVVERVRATWAGVADVQLWVSPSLRNRLAADTLVATAVNDLLPELVFNSVKHGRAQNITIEIENDDPRILCLKVTDDGTQEIDRERIGLGTKLLDDAAMRWVRTRERNQTVTAAWLPFEPAA